METITKAQYNRIFIKVKPPLVKMEITSPTITTKWAKRAIR